MAFYLIKQIIQQTPATKARLSEQKLTFQCTNKIADYRRHKKIKIATISRSKTTQHKKFRTKSCGFAIPV